MNVKDNGNDIKVREIQLPNGAAAVLLQSWLSISIQIFFSPGGGYPSCSLQYVRATKQGFRHVLKSRMRLPRIGY